MWMMTLHKGMYDTSTMYFDHASYTIFHLTLSPTLIVCRSLIPASPGNVGRPSAMYRIVGFSTGFNLPLEYSLRTLSNRFLSNAVGVSKNFCQSAAKIY